MGAGRSVTPESVSRRNLFVAGRRGKQEGPAWPPANPDRPVSVSFFPLPPRFLISGIPLLWLWKQRPPCLSASVVFSRPSRGRVGGSARQLRRRQPLPRALLGAAERVGQAGRQQASRG